MLFTSWQITLLVLPAQAGQLVPVPAEPLRSLWPQSPAFAGKGSPVAGRLSGGWTFLLRTFNSPVSKLCPSSSPSTVHPLILFIRQNGGDRFNQWRGGMLIAPGLPQLCDGVCAAGGEDGWWAFQLESPQASCSHGEAHLRSGRLLSTGLLGSSAAYKMLVIWLICWNIA